MKKQTLFKGILSTGIVLLWGSAPCAYAEESSSFRLYHDVPNYAQQGPMTSDSFKSNEGGTTYIAAPLASSSYQIVQAPPAVAEEEAEEEAEGVTEPIGHYRGHGTVLANLLAQLQQRREEGRIIVRTEEEEEPAKAAAPQEPIPEPFPDIDYQLPKPKPVYKVAVKYPRRETLLGPLHYFYTIDEERLIEAPLPHYGLSRDVFAVLERMFTFQRRLVLMQGIAALVFLLAFQIFLLKLPRSAYAPIRKGRMRLLFLLIPIFGKRRKEEEEGQKKAQQKKCRTTARRKSKQPFRRRKL